MKPRQLVNREPECHLFSLQCNLIDIFLPVPFQYLITAKGGFDKPRRFIFGGVSQGTTLLVYVVSFYDYDG